MAYGMSHNNPKNPVGRKQESVRRSGPGSAQSVTGAFLYRVGRFLYKALLDFLQSVVGLYNACFGCSRSEIAPRGLAQI
eukprot:3266765-Rhodomonas_salina.2